MIFLGERHISLGKVVSLLAKAGLLEIMTSGAETEKTGGKLK